MRLERSVLDINPHEPPPPPLGYVNLNEARINEVTVHVPNSFNEAMLIADYLQGFKETTIRTSSNTIKKKLGILHSYII